MKNVLNKPISSRNFFQTASLGLLGAGVSLSSQRAVAQEMSPNLPTALQRHAYSRKYF